MDFRNRINEFVTDFNNNDLRGELSVDFFDGENNYEEASFSLDGEACNIIAAHQEGVTPFVLAEDTEVFHFSTFDDLIRATREALLEAEF